MGQAAGSRAGGAQQEPGVMQLGGAVQGDATLMHLHACQPLHALCRQLPTATRRRVMVSSERDVVSILQAVEDMCLHKFAEALHARLQKVRCVVQWCR